MGENYWDFPNLRTVKIPITIVNGQSLYPLNSQVTNLNEAVGIVGFSHRLPDSDARTLNAANQGAAMIDDTIFQAAFLNLNTKQGSSRQVLALPEIGVRSGVTGPGLRVPYDNTIDLTNGKSFVQLAATSGVITAAAGQVIELTVYYVGEGPNC